MYDFGFVLVTQEQFENAQKSKIRVVVWRKTTVFDCHCCIEEVTEEAVKIRGIFYSRSEYKFLCL